MGNGLSSLSPEEIDELRKSNFTDNELRRLYKRFKKLDVDSSGTITLSEFKSIPELSMNPLLERIIELFDTDHDNTVSFQEFIKALSVFTAGTSKDDKLRFAFNVYDIDGDGYISNGELYMTLKQMSGTNLTEEQLQQVVDKTIMENDLNHDGKLSFEEFKMPTAYNIHAC